MQIIMTSAYGGYAVGSHPNLSAQDQASFVQLGVAQFVTTKHSPLGADVYKNMTTGQLESWNSVTGDYSLEGDGGEVAGVSPANTAAANAAAIQAALDIGGRVTMTNPGVYLINTTLKIGSDTDLYLAPGVEIKASGAGVGNLINSKVMSAATSSVTITWAANTIVATVNWTAHGLTTADSVWITGANQYQYLGVFPIISITNANSFVIKLKRVPTAAATGTILAVKAQVNTRITGGVWNYNFTGGNDAAGYLASCLRLGGIQGLYLKSITGKDTKKFVCDLGAIDMLHVEDTRGGGLNSDCIKLYGPMFNASVYALGPSAGDDLLSMQCKEPAAYVANMWTFGDIIGVLVSGSGGYSATGGLVLYSNDTGYIDGVRIDGFTGSTAGVTQLRIENNGTGSGLVGTVTINNPVFVGSDSCISILGAQTIQSLLIVNPKQNSVNYTGRLIYIDPHAITAKIKVIGGVSSFGENLFNTSATGGEVRIEFDGMSVADGIWNAFNLAGAGTTRLRLRNLEMKVNAGNSMFNIAGTAIVYIDADNISTPSGNHVMIKGGTPTVYTENRGWKVDLSLVTALDGVIAYNTNAALGTLAAAGLVMCQGTTWHLMADPTKVY